MDAALLMLVDGRFPAGGHAYSAGVEAAVSAGDITDVATLERYLMGRLATTGRVDAAFAANACVSLAEAPPGLLEEAAHTLDLEYSARTPSPYLRSVSRRLGRQLLRPATGIWDTPALALLSTTTGGPHQPIALGAVTGAAGGGPVEAVALACHHLTAAVLSAAIRLLGLDPLELVVLQERVGGYSDSLTGLAAQWAAMSPSDLPADGGSLTEILGQRRGSLHARMFVA